MATTYTYVWNVDENVTTIIDDGFDPRIKQLFFPNCNINMHVGLGSIPFSVTVTDYDSVIAKFSSIFIKNEDLSIETTIEGSLTKFTCKRNGAVISGHSYRPVLWVSFPTAASPVEINNFWEVINRTLCEDAKFEISSDRKSFVLVDWYNKSQTAWPWQLVWSNQQEVTFRIQIDYHYYVYTDWNKEGFNLNRLYPEFKLYKHNTEVFNYGGRKTPQEIITEQGGTASQYSFLCEIGDCFLENNISYIKQCEVHTSNSTPSGVSLPYKPNSNTIEHNNYNANYGLEQQKIRGNNYVLYSDTEHNAFWRYTINGNTSAYYHLGMLPDKSRWTLIYQNDTTDTVPSFPAKEGVVYIVDQKWISEDGYMVYKWTDTTDKNTDIQITYSSEYNLKHITQWTVSPRYRLFLTTNTQTGWEDNAVNLKTALGYHNRYIVKTYQETYQENSTTYNYLNVIGIQFYDLSPTMSVNLDFAPDNIYRKLRLDGNDWGFYGNSENKLLFHQFDNPYGLYKKYGNTDYPVRELNYSSLDELFESSSPTSLFGYTVYNLNITDSTGPVWISGLMEERNVLDAVHSTPNFFQFILAWDKDFSADTWGYCFARGSSDKLHIIDVDDYEEYKNTVFSPVSRAISNLCQMNSISIVNLQSAYRYTGTIKYRTSVYAVQLFSEKPLQN